LGFLGKDALLQKTALRRATVKVGPDGDEVVMRELSVTDRMRAGKMVGEVKEGDTEGQTRALLAQVALALCNEDESPMCANDDEVSLLASALMDRSSRLVQDMITECLALNGFGKEALKDAVGNSAEIPSSGSSSSSLAISDTQVPTPSLAA
jgi:hypothetical protein